MGNRAIIKTEKGHIGLYLHWNGGRDSVEAFLEYCNIRGFRSPESDGYGWARLAQVVGNFFGGGLSVGMCEVNANGPESHDGEYCDNGAYIIRNWQIIGREDFDGHEQNEYNREEMLLSIDEAQPEKEQIGEYLKAQTVKTCDLRIGDVVVFMDWNGSIESGAVVGFGSDRYVNGTNVKGMPYINRFGGNTPEENINNYITGDTARIKTTTEEPTQEPEPAEPENPVEIFINEQLNGIELKFKSKPDEETREALKAAGFRWHRKKCVWYAKNDPQHMSKAQLIAKAAAK